MRTATPMLLLSLLIGPACSSGGGDDVFELHYDENNLSAPSLAGATYEAAARFTTVQTAPLAGGELTEVNFYVSSVPASCKVKVYGANTASAPGTLLYTATVTGDIGPAWNSHVLTTPVAIPNGDLWIAIEFTHALPQATIGCDPGPAVQDGDWLYASTDGNWIPFVTRVPSVSINWNIRGIVTLPA